MKNIIKVLGSLLFGLVIYIYLVYPRDYKNEFIGVRYRTSAFGQNEIQKVILHFDSKFSKNYFFGHKYYGTIEISGIQDTLENKNMRTKGQIKKCPLVL